MELGKQIAYYRKEKGLTQDGLAKQLNISNQAVSKWEANQSFPDVSLLPKLADIFEVSLDQLFGREWNGTEKGNTMGDLPWENDGELRAVVYIGTKLMENEQLTDKERQVCENVAFEFHGDALNISSAFGVCCGEVNGNIDAGGSVECNNVGGDVHAGDSVECNDVGGDVHAGDSVECNNVCGMVSAGDSVTCNNIGGMVSAGDWVSCNNVAGSVYAETVNLAEQS